MTEHGREWLIPSGLRHDFPPGISGRCSLGSILLQDKEVLMATADAGPEFGSTHSVIPS